MTKQGSRTKIIATLGPASSKDEILSQMFMEGLDVCRLNFSHGNHEEHLKTIRLINELNRRYSTNVAILVDLQGPKLRIGDVENNSINLADGEEVLFVNEPCMGNRERIYMSYEKLAADVKPGEKILVDDGKIMLEVVDTNGTDKVRLKILSGGILSSKKGVNLPNTKVSLPAMTEKDKKDAWFALEHEVDWIALSFVRSVNDILDLKELIKKSKRTSVKVIAKIEKPEALNELDQIIDMADGIMIARGDLGVEVPFDQVPLIQKEIIQKCMIRAKSVIVATQMMESMITNFRPTRAEANDVANAVLDGADALMLSGETSTGKYPVEVVQSMQKIIDWTEKGYKFFRNNPPMEFSRSFLSDSICFNACKMAEQSGARAIITFTHSGYTAFQIASYRPKARIYAFTDNEKILKKLSMVWGVRTFHTRIFDNIDDYIRHSINLLLEQKLIHEEDVVIHVGSTPIPERGKTNMIKMSFV